MGLILGWHSFTSADNVANSGPSIQNPAGRPVPNLKVQAVTRRCEDMDNPYALAESMSCVAIDEVGKKKSTKIQFTRTLHIHNRAEIAGWMTDSLDADEKIRNLQILDLFPTGLNKQKSEDFCKSRGGRLPTNDELGLLINAGFFKIAKKAKSLRDKNREPDFEKYNAMTSSPASNQKYLAWTLGDPPRSESYDPNISSWKDPDKGGSGFNLAYCVVPGKTKK